MEDSIDSSNFSLRGYLVLIEKDLLLICMVLQFMWRRYLLFELLQFLLYQSLFFSLSTVVFDVFFILYRSGSLNQLSSLWNSPWHLAIAEAFAKGNLYFLSYASANYCQSKIVLTIHGSDSGEKSPSKDMKIFFSSFQICCNQYLYLKTQPIGAWKLQCTQFLQNWF